MSDVYLKDRATELPTSGRLLVTIVSPHVKQNGRPRLTTPKASPIRNYLLSGRRGKVDKFLA
jgi:hypothetical protein